MGNLRYRFNPYRSISRKAKVHVRSLLENVTSALLVAVGTIKLQMLFFRKANLNGSIHEKIANQALLLAMEWGADLLKPIQERLIKLHPTLTPAELDQYNAMAQEAMKWGHGLVYDQVKRLGQASQALPEQCRSLFMKRYPWATEATFSRVYSQGMYYAWHDGIGA